MRSPLLKCLVVVAISIAASGLAPADWPQWRGPSRDGYVADAAIPKISHWRLESELTAEK
jgi:hypothetical protein